MAWKSGNAAFQPPALPPAATEADATDPAEAAKAVSATLQQELRVSRRNLIDLLQDGDQSFSFSQPGWPQTLHTTRLKEIPQSVADRRPEVCSRQGFFPEINYAWATVDNSVFLWRIDDREDAPVEYNGEEQAIYAVGLAKAKPGVFPESIQYLLILATPVEVMLLGVCFDATGANLVLQPLPLYAIPSDTTCMAAITCTSSGAIFMGGRDGHLYELLYSASDTWREKRCRMRCVSRGLGRLLPSALRLWTTDPSTLTISQIVVDEERRLLYTRSQGSQIVLYSLPPSGPPARIADYSHQSNASEGAASGGGGVPIVHMAVVSKTESISEQLDPARAGLLQIHLVAVTSDGARLYFTTTSNTIWGGQAPYPACLKKVGSRARPSDQPLAFPAAQGLQAMAPAFGALGQQHSLKVETAYYKEGLLVLVAREPEGEGSRLIVVEWDLMAEAPGSVCRECVSFHSIPGAVVHVAESAAGGQAAARALVAAGPPTSKGELSTQHLLPRRKLVVITSKAAVELEKARPVDILEQLLERITTEHAVGGADENNLKFFFKSYGPAEAAAMCIILATSPSSPVLALAKMAYEDRELVGQAQLWTDADAGGSEPDAQPDAFNYGQFRKVREVQYSGAYEGALLYTARLLRPVWDTALAAPARPAAPGPGAAPPSPRTGPLRCLLPAEPLEELERRVRRLVQFLSERHVEWGGDSKKQQYHWVPMERRRKWRRLEYPHQTEAFSFACITSLLELAAQSLLLLSLVAHPHFQARVLQLLSADEKAALCSLKFHQLVSTPAGHAMAKHLVECLMRCAPSVTAPAAGDAAAGPSEVAAIQSDQLANTLRAGCATFFGEDKRTFYNASKVLELARARYAEPGGEGPAQETAAQALEGFKQWVHSQGHTQPLSGDASLGNLHKVVGALGDVRHFQGVVELPACYAAAMDPARQAEAELAAGDQGGPALAARQRCYAAITAVLRKLAAPAGGVTVTPADMERLHQARQQLVALAVRSEDKIFHDVLYDEMMALELHEDLLQCGGAPLEAYLRHAGGLQGPPPAAASDLELSPRAVSCLLLLVKMYQVRRQYSRAAATLMRLAERPSAPGAQAGGEGWVGLEERERHISQALLLVKGAGEAPAGGEAASLADIAAKQHLLAFQKEICKDLADLRMRRALAPTEHLNNDLKSLQNNLLSLQELYEQYASKYEMWGMCVLLIEFSQQSSSQVSQMVPNLWDKYLTAPSAPAPDGSSLPVGQSVTLSESCKRAAALGERLYPSTVTFPVAHVCQRLEFIAAGLFPPGAAGWAAGGEAEAPARQAIVQALAAACKGDLEMVLTGYNTLLGLKDGDLQSHQVQMRLLSSVLVVLSHMFENLPPASAMFQNVPTVDLTQSRIGGRSTEQDRAYLAERCDMYATLLYSLQAPQSEKSVLEAEFNKLSSQIKQRFTPFG